MTDTRAPDPTRRRFFAAAGATAFAAAVAAPSASAAISAGTTSATKSMVDAGVHIVSSAWYDQLTTLPAATIAAVINTHAKDGAIIRLEPGTYSLEQPIFISRTAKSFTLDLRGTTLIRPANTVAIRVTGTFQTESPIGVGSISRGSIVINDANVDVLTIPLSAPLPAGVTLADVVKLVSNRRIPEARPERNDLASRSAAFLQIQAISADRQTLTVYYDEIINDLRDDLTSGDSNVRLLIPSTNSVTILGGTIRTDDIVPTDPQPAIELRGLLRPRIEGAVVRGVPNTAISIVGCYGHRVRDCDVDFAMDQVDSGGGGQLGYGLNSLASVFGIVTGCTFRNVRHAYTNDTPRIVADSDDYPAYGRSYMNQIIGCRAHGTSGTAWDTHPGSMGETFADVSAVGSAQNGIQLRGIKHRVSGATIVGYGRGVTAICDTDANTTDTWGHIVDDVTVRRASGGAILLDATRPSRGREVRPSVFRNIYCENSPKLATIVSGTAILENIIFESADTTTMDRLLTTNDADLTVVEATVDIAGLTSPIGSIARFEGTAASRIELRDVSIVCGAQGIAMLAAVAAQRTGTLLARGLAFDSPPHAASGGGYLGDMTRLSYESLVSWSTSAGKNLVSSAAHSISSGVYTGAAVNAHVSRSGDDVTIFMKSNASSYWLPEGRRVGQRMLVANCPSTTVSLIVKNPAGTSTLATLANNKIVSLVWSGDTWMVTT